VDAFVVAIDLMVVAMVVAGSVCPEGEPASDLTVFVGGITESEVNRIFAAGMRSIAAKSIVADGLICRNRSVSPTSDAADAMSVLGDDDAIRHRYPLADSGCRSRCKAPFTPSTVVITLPRRK
jgi:hypothetical protein